MGRVGLGECAPPRVFMSPRHQLTFHLPPPGCPLITSQVPLVMPAPRRDCPDARHGHIACPHGRRQCRCNLCSPQRIGVPALLVYLDKLLANLCSKDAEFKTKPYLLHTWPRWHPTHTYLLGRFCFIQVVCSPLSRSHAEWLKLCQQKRFS